MKKILIVNTDRFSRRNLETSNVLARLSTQYDLCYFDYETYTSRPVWHKVLSNMLTKTLQYRFSEIHQFKKHQLKKKYKDSFQLNHYDRVNTWLGFPCVKSKRIFAFLYRIHQKLKPCVEIDSTLDLVLITSCQESLSQSILRWASLRKIPAICLINSWDHLTFRGPIYDYPDTVVKYLVWGEIQKEELKHFHKIPENKIAAIGSLQFDYFYDLKKENTRRSEIALSDEEFVIFLPAYNERHGFNEPAACRKIIQYMQEKRAKYKLIIRPYPKDITFHDRFKDVLTLENVVENQIEADLSQDRRKFGLYFKHSDLVLSGPGTAAMEAMYFEKPLIFLAMETRENMKNINIAQERFFTDHYENLIAEGGSYFCTSFEQMIDAVERVLNKTHDFSKQNQILRRQITYLEGYAADRLVNEVEQVFKNT